MEKLTATMAIFRDILSLNIVSDKAFNSNIWANLGPHLHLYEHNVFRNTNTKFKVSKSSMETLSSSPTSLGCETRN